MLRYAALLVAFVLPAFSQTIVRYDSNASSTSSSCAPGQVCQIFAQPGATVQVCTPPQCNTLATTYTDNTGGTACAGSSQVTVPASGLVCSGVADNQGNFGFWIPVTGTYYNVFVYYGGTMHGPYPITPGSGTGQSIFSSYQFGTQPAITGVANYLQTTYPNIFTATQTGAGTVMSPYIDAIGLGSETANTVAAAPNGSNGAWSFRNLVSQDMPNPLQLLPSGGTSSIAACNSADPSNSACLTLKAGSGAASLLLTNTGTYIPLTTLGIGEANGGQLTAINFEFNGITAVSLTAAGVGAPGSNEQILYNNAGSIGAGALATDGVNLLIGSGEIIGSGSTYAWQLSTNTTFTGAGAAKITPTSGNQAQRLDVYPSGSGTTSVFASWNASGSNNVAALQMQVSGNQALLETVGRGTPGTGITVLDIGEYSSAGSAMTAINFQFNAVTKATISSAGLFTTVNETVSSFTAGVVHSSAGGVLSSSAVSLTADVSGTLPVANGGTGLATLTSNAIYKGAGTSVMAVSSLTDDGTTVTTTEPVQAAKITFTAAAPTVAAAQVGFGSTTAASTNCGSIVGGTACLVINVAGTTRYVPYF